jgi:hypothetical protein
MSRQRILRDGLEDGLEKLEKSLTPTINFRGMKIYKISDIPVKLVQLTKWLPAVPTELDFIKSEYERIKADKTRVCIVATSDYRIALFVNDMTNGVFNSLGEEN